MSQQANTETAIKEVSSLLKKFKPKFDEVSKSISETTGLLERSWSGSWIGYHANLYFQNYQTPGSKQRFSIEWGGVYGIDPGWASKNLDEVWKYVISKAPHGFDLDAMDSKLTELQEANKHLKTLYELNAKDQVLIDRLKDINVDFTMYDYIKARKPGTVVSRDSEAVYQGIKVPPHVQCQAFGRALSQCISTSETLLKLKDLITGTEDIPSTITLIDDELSHLDPLLVSKVGKLYSDKHYSEAVGMAFRIVKDRLRDISGYENGYPAFDEAGLYIKGAAAENVDEAFQVAVKRLLGSIDKFRNEKLHTSMADLKNKDRALSYLHICSLALSFLADKQYSIKPKTKKS